MRRSRIAACWFAIALPVCAQEQAAVLANSGDPIHAPFACTSENLDWAGLACSEDDPCAIYLELNAIAGVGQKIFLAGDLHAQSATLSSILLSTDDNGLTWKEPAARVRGASLDQAQFLDAGHGWIAGETVNPLARDPFFLITSDGGASWRNRAVTDDGGPGSVQRFRFDSPQHGELLIDSGPGAEGGRYREYETDTAGDSWSLHASTAAPPKPLAAPQGDSDYRITSGRDSYRIERRTGAMWAPVASFAVIATTCKSAQPSPEPAPAAQKDQD